ncbi:MAG: transcriptional regulator NrdR [bacterium]
MRCPYCRHPENKVLDSRESSEGRSIRRRRECLKCGNRFTTYERIEDIPIMVIKRDKSSEVFDRKKLMNGIIKACNKRPVSLSVVEKFVEDIEKKIYDVLGPEITTKEIGEMILENLYNLDEVAYVRFASVYKNFSDINGFMRELQEIQRIKKEADKWGKCT